FIFQRATCEQPVSIIPPDESSSYFSYYVMWVINPVNNGSVHSGAFLLMGCAFRKVRTSS
ncbi:hypothetical protein, partial [Escherichia coli]|uniref:hypothetical protein n=1 Tax=Escherichia coli TaxID=562 RepID=UPI0032B3B496